MSSIAVSTYVHNSVQKTQGRIVESGNKVVSLRSARDCAKNVYLNNLAHAPFNFS